MESRRSKELGMLSVLREMPDVKREPPEVEFATLSVLREQLSVFRGTPRSLRGLPSVWREPLPELRGRLSVRFPEKSGAYGNPVLVVPQLNVP